MKKDYFLCFLRVSISLMMLTHGLPKLNKFQMFLGFFPNPIGVGSELTIIIAVFAEVFCSIFLIFGLFNRLPLIPLILTMLGAQVFHLADPFAKKELALMYLICYIAMFGLGIGSVRMTWFKKLEEKLEAPLKKIGL